MPLTAATTWPTQSILMPYSQRVPGSKVSGTESAIFFPEPARGKFMVLRYLAESTFQMSDVKPAVCVSNWRKVIWAFGACNKGWPLESQPVKSFTPASSGKNLAAGSSSVSLPCSTSCMAAAPTMGLVIEASQNTVSGVIATPRPSARSPKAASYTVPSEELAAATTPGTWPACTACCSRWSAFGFSFEISIEQIMGCDAK